MAASQGIAPEELFHLPITGHRNRRRVVVGYSLVLNDAFTRDVLCQSRWNFHPQGYVNGTAKHGPGRYSRVLLHRVIYEHYIGPVPLGLEIDHIDRNKLNNVPTNLRAVTRSVNNANIGPRKENTSGYHGVVCFAKTGKWVAQIKVRRHAMNLGYYVTAREAADAVNRAYQKYFPEVQIPNP